jgi:hypothetical protein
MLGQRQLLLEALPPYSFGCACCSSLPRNSRCRFLAINKGSTELLPSAGGGAGNETSCSLWDSSDRLGIRQKARAGRQREGGVAGALPMVVMKLSDPNAVHREAAMGLVLHALLSIASKL